MRQRLFCAALLAVCISSCGAEGPPAAERPANDICGLLLKGEIPPARDPDGHALAILLHAFKLADIRFTSCRSAANSSEEFQVSFQRQGKPLPLSCRVSGSMVKNQERLQLACEFPGTQLLQGNEVEELNDLVCSLLLNKELPPDMQSYFQIYQDFKNAIFESLKLRFESCTANEGGIVEIKYGSTDEDMHCSMSIALTADLAISVSCTSAQLTAPTERKDRAIKFRSEL